MTLEPDTSPSMDKSKRILAKLLGPEADTGRFEATGEPLDLVVELLRDVAKCRNTRKWVIESFGIDPGVSPATFYEPLEIPRINFVETLNRDLEIQVVSLKETRKPEDPVSIGNLNSVLKELYRTLNEVNEKKVHPVLFLIRDMSEEKIDRVSELIASIKTMKGKLTGFLLTSRRVKVLEDEFKNLFPSEEARPIQPLRSSLDRVEQELVFYRTLREFNGQWKALGLDLFRVLKNEELPNLMDNLEELGKLLWNIVYNRPRVERSLELAGISFADSTSLFDENRVPVHNF